MTGHETSRIEELTRRIAESSHFHKSSRQSGLLQYLCRHALDHPDRELHEQEIGVQFFERDPGYDTNQDNIVRVNASELRKRLARYFETDGVAEPILIEVPKGSYTPRFVTRPKSVPSGKRRPLALYVALGVCLILATSTAWLWTENRSLRLPTPFRSPALSLLWSKLLDKNGAADVVVADSCLSLLQDIVGRPVSLQEYLSHDYMNSAREFAKRTGKRDEVEWLTSRRYTSLADVHMVSKILRKAGGADLTVHFARDYQAERIRSANAVLIGSKRSNPWVEAFEDRMNFRVEYDEANREPVIRNRKPQAGEPDAYRITDPGLHTVDAFAVVAFLPNPARTGHVLILAGNGMQGTDAAGEFVTQEQEFARFLDKIRKPWPVVMPHFEALLKARIMGGAVRGFDLVSYRVYED